MDHGESLQDTIAREMKEEVNLKGDFTYKIIASDEPAHLDQHNFWQLRLVFSVFPQSLVFSPGDDGDEVAFMDPAGFKNSDSATEHRIYSYAQIA
jgi:ADP-ribose pyrophosphatase YjhB (NUDIX family)